MGRLSNPPAAVPTIADQGRRDRRRPPHTSQATPAPPEPRRRVGRQEKPGRLSNPAQHRLSEGQVDHLIRLYREGASIDGLASRYEVHRTTVMAHLERAGIARRRVVRKMTDESVAEAAERYERGASLSKVACAFGVHERTITKEFQRAEVSIRPRRGWCP